MGYACPVCETPHADARHLANHLAFTALLGNEEHESWLDEHAPEWEQCGEDELAEKVVEDASEVEFPQVFEDTTDHDHRDDPQPGELTEEHRTRGPSGRTEPDAETAAAIEKAREMTRQAHDDDNESSEDENG